MDIIAAMTLGLIGSMHCIGMCGPLVMALPGNADIRWKFIAGRLIYTAGKTVMYGMMGAVLGLAGKSILISYQQHVSIIAGIVLLMMVAAPAAISSKMNRFSPLQHLSSVLKKIFSQLLIRRGMAVLFSLGMLNGLLPCGLVYTALIGATVVADPVKSALFMMIFGLGTVPALLAVSLAGKVIAQNYRVFFSRAVPMLSVVLAVLLILRGMNLGIPMISPHVSHTAEQEKVMDCCPE